MNRAGSNGFGLSPKDKHGNSIVLHHYKQRTEGPIIAMPQKYHQEKTKQLHPLGNKKGHGISNRPEFNLWKKEFWANQASKELQNRNTTTQSPSGCP
nr:HNH/ENDO VII family nuclease [Pseudomonas putida]